VGMGALGITKVEVYHSMCRTGVESANAGAARKALRLSLRCMLETIPRSPPKKLLAAGEGLVGQSWRCFEVLFDGNNCSFLTASWLLVF